MNHLLRPLDISSFSPLLEGAFNSLWQGTLLSVLLWIGLALSPKLNAATRYWILWSALITILVIPFAPYLGPAMGKQRAHWLEQDTFVRTAPQFPGSSKTEQPEETIVADRSALPLPPQEAPASPTREEAKTLGPVWNTPRLRAEYAVAILTGWFIVSLILLVRIARSYGHLRHLRKTAVVLPSSWEHATKASLELIRSSRRLQVRLSSTISMPLAIGFRHPLTILPETLLHSFTDMEYQQILLHEIAHIRRRDDWGKLAQEIIRALFWWQPAVHWLSTRLDFEREVACDDWVLQTTGQPKAYALCLTRLFELGKGCSGTALASGMIFVQGHLQRRIHNLLNFTQSRSTSPRHIAVFPSSVLLLGTGLLIAGFAAPPFLIESYHAEGHPPGSLWLQKKAAGAEPSPIEAGTRSRNAVEFSATQLQVDRVNAQTQTNALSTNRAPLGSYELRGHLNIFKADIRSTKRGAFSDATHELAGFSVRVQDCNYHIQIFPDPLNVLDRIEASADESELVVIHTDNPLKARELAQKSQDRLPKQVRDALRISPSSNVPTRVANSTVGLLQGGIPRSMEGSLPVIWLATASSCYLHEPKASMLSFYEMGPRQGERNIISSGRSYQL